MKIKEMTVLGGTFSITYDRKAKFVVYTLWCGDGTTFKLVFKKMLMNIKENIIKLSNYSEFR